MVKINPPTINSMSIRDAEDEYDLNGVFLDIDECEISSKRLEEIKSGTVSRFHGSHQGGTLRPIRFGASDMSESEGGEELIEIKIDFEDLWKMIYEHRQYSAAKGFSDSEMRVLKAMRDINVERITAKEIKQHGYTEDYSEGAVHNALSNLVEKELVEKVQHGLYSLLDF